MAGIPLLYGFYFDGFMNIEIVLSLHSVKGLIKKEGYSKKIRGKAHVMN
jgi:hypothetical protein